MRSRIKKRLSQLIMFSCVSLQACGGVTTEVELQSAQISLEQSAEDAIESIADELDIRNEGFGAE